MWACSRATKYVEIRGARDKSPDASVSRAYSPRECNSYRTVFTWYPPWKTVNCLTFIVLPRIMPSLSSPLIEYGMYNPVLSTNTETRVSGEHSRAGYRMPPALKQGSREYPRSPLLAKCESHEFHSVILTWTSRRCLSIARPFARIFNLHLSPVPRSKSENNNLKTISPRITSPCVRAKITIWSFAHAKPIAVENNWIESNTLGETRYNIGRSW